MLIFFFLLLRYFIMWSANDVLGKLIPNCPCGATFDMRFCAPHILPCAHTFCFMCLSENVQRKKRRCPLCQKRYSTFILNAALAGHESSSASESLSSQNGISKRISMFIKRFIIPKTSTHVEEMICLSKSNEKNEMSDVFGPYEQQGIIIAISTCEYIYRID
ncbi:zinc finger, C3HC4 type [Dictyocaulus viviparus]|uniref:Zinc finger, C3HC4 type n=1 Tax=Dictyocaulus viviparus TaxID=29172 RepID=A0A0D8XHS0_DICVI|nr:zinc finger, C3HC4 type [Dictyocaulus viviparus]